MPPPPRVVRRMTFAEGGHLVSALDFTCHLGTHLDTPLHFLDGQPGLEAMPLEKFRGRGCVIDAPRGRFRRRSWRGSISIRSTT